MEAGRGARRRPDRCLTGGQTGCPTEAKQDARRGAQWGQTECPTGPDGVPDGPDGVADGRIIYF
jgi:hypothetical protein